MKLSSRSATTPALPTIRSLPQRGPRLIDTPGLVPTIRIAAAAIAGTLILSGAAFVVIGVADGTLDPIVVPLLSLATLAATAAFLAGRSVTEDQTSAATGRAATKGRLGTAAGAKNARANAGANKGSVQTGSATSAAATPAEEAVGDVLRTKFLDEISQSLRAPITSICLAARIIRKHFDTTPEVVAHFGDTLLAEADRLGQIVDEFLELARLESGLVQWNDKPVDAADLIQGAVSEIEPLALNYGVSIAFTLEPGLPSIEVDRERITQALTILLALSVRSATEGSEIVIQIAGAHGGWVFSVGGTSFVYPHAEARKVDSRADAAMPDVPESRPPENAGLALCLSREIVSRYQGRLWLEGLPGPSGCIRFTVPYKQHRRAAAPMRPNAPVVEAAANTAGAPLSELDLEARRERAVQALQERASKCPTAPAGDPVDASTLAADKSPDAAKVAFTVPASASLTPQPRPPSLKPAEPVTAASTPPHASEVESLPAEATNATPSTRKLSFARSEAQQDDESGRVPVSRPRPVSTTAMPPAAVAPRDTETQPDESISVGAEQTRRPENEDLAWEPEVEVELVDDTPVRAPVSGTMITAHHRSFGAPVLAQPGVPALSGVQSAASAAIQGSDELLLEIAEAQSSDGRALVVSDEVRNLLATAPGTVPAVSGQTQPSTTARSGYTPSRRRMVQAPWVVRSEDDTKTESGASASNVSTSQTPEAGGQRARLSDRLAKRLGISPDSRSGETRTGGNADSRSPLSRPRRHG